MQWPKTYLAGNDNEEKMRVQYAVKGTGKKEELYAESGDYARELEDILKAKYKKRRKG